MAKRTSKSAVLVQISWSNLLMQRLAPLCSTVKSAILQRGSLVLNARANYASLLIHRGYHFKVRCQDSPPSTRLSNDLHRWFPILAMLFIDLDPPKTIRQSKNERKETRINGRGRRLIDSKAEWLGEGSNYFGVKTGLTLAPSKRPFSFASLPPGCRILPVIIRIDSKWI